MYMLCLWLKLILAIYIDSKLNHKLSIIILIINNTFILSAFTVEPSDIVYAPGQTVTLNCQATDSNGRSVSINWKRNNTWLIDPTNKPWKFLHNNSLCFASISEKDGGEFKCGASIIGTSEAIYSRVATVQAACKYIKS